MKTISLISCLIFSSVAFGQYTQNAFVIANDAGEQILTNRDLNCVRIKMAKNGKIGIFGLTSEARRYFYEYTKNHKGSRLSTSICGRQLNNPKIMAAISSGEIQVSDLTSDDVKCLEQSFDTRAECRDCPVCKNYSPPADQSEAAIKSGFKLTKVQPNSLYLKMGLKEGDVVQEINGHRLESAGDAIRTLNKLTGTDQVTIKIERDGKPETLNIKLR